jgi:sugar/nucleoside kinase (ribokinase family)
LNSTVELLCIGNAMVDVFVSLAAEAMEKLGIIQPVQHIGREQAELILSELGVFSGGSTAVSSGGGASNVAKIAALLGMKCGFQGCVGQDPLAAIFEKELAGSGCAAFLVRGKEKTGVCFVCNSGGETRSETRIAASPGAALEFTEADVREELISAAEAVVLDGYVLDRRSLVRRILELADRHGIPVALDVGSVFQVRSKAEEILHYCRNYPLLLFMNADEAIAFFNTIRKSREEETGLNEREKEGMILRDVCPMLKIITDGELFPIVVVKLGSRGAVVAAGGTVYREGTFALAPRNATGAGDAFCAAFLAAWIRGKSLSKCAALGNRTAREILKVPGTGITGGKLKPLAKALRK